MSYDWCTQVFCVMHKSGVAVKQNETSCGDRRLKNWHFLEQSEISTKSFVGHKIFNFAINGSVLSLS